MNWIIEAVIIILTFIVLLTPLVAIHELGHLLMSKLVGVKILEYGIGLPPRAKGWLRKGVLWSLNWIPLGGFVRTYGDHDALDKASFYYQKDRSKALEIYLQDRFQELIFAGDLERFLIENGLEYDEDWQKFEKKYKTAKTEAELEELENQKNQLQTLMEWELDANIDSKEAFFNRGWLAQSLILVGGVTFNFLTAIFLFFVVYAGTGTLETISYKADTPYSNLITVNTESSDVYASGIYKDSPAYDLGIRSPAKIFSINDKPAKSFQSLEDLNQEIADLENQEIEVVFQNQDEDKETVTAATIIKATEIGDQEELIFGALRYGPKSTFKAKNFGSLVVLPWYEVSDAVKLNFDFLGQLLSGDSDSIQLVSGPIGVGNIGQEIISQTGLVGFIYLLAVISIGLGVFNLLPIPALDGGRWLIVTINKITGKRNKKVESFLIYGSFIIIIILTLAVAVKDVNDWLTGFWDIG